MGSSGLTDAHLVCARWFQGGEAFLALLRTGNHLLQNLRLRIQSKRSENDVESLRCPDKELTDTCFGDSLFCSVTAVIIACIDGSKNPATRGLGQGQWAFSLEFIKPGVNTPIELERTSSYAQVRVPISNTTKLDVLGVTGIAKSQFRCLIKLVSHEGYIILKASSL